MRYGSTSAKAFLDAHPLLGKRVRFTMDGLGASKLGELHCCVEKTFGSGDEGEVAFLHPNPEMRDWFYVQVIEHRPLGNRTLYVGCTLRMCEVK